MAVCARDPPRILVVDDDARFACTVRDLLRDDGYAAECALTGRDAIAKVASFSPDIVVLDLIMSPETIHGRDVLAWLKANSPSTAVVVLTGDDDWKPLDGTAKLRKPCTLEQLLDAIAAALGSKSAGRPPRA